MAIATATTLGTRRAVLAPSRRQFGGASLAALCGAAFAGAVVLPDPGEAFPPPASPDAELIRLCAECDALQGQVDAIWADRMTHLINPEQIAIERIRDAAQQPLLEQMDPLLERICEMRATTAQGHAARARTLIAWDKDPCWTHDGCWNSQLLGAIVRDLVAVA
jgi:hypothetical protein